MAQEINLGGTIYISSKRAAEISGYAQDYIGQLARSGQIDARRVAGMWYVLEDSVLRYKEGSASEALEQTDVDSAQKEVESVQDQPITIDGVELVLATHAAESTGYAHDYVTQLARSGKIPAHQVGSRWYVEQKALAQHKKEKDALLAAVQADSVGLVREDDKKEQSNVSRPAETASYYAYTNEDAGLLPGISKPDARHLAQVEGEAKQGLASEEIRDEVDPFRTLDDPITPIPIRRVQQTTKPRNDYNSEPIIRAQPPVVPPPHTASHLPRAVMVGIVLIGLLVSGAGATLYFVRSADIVLELPRVQNGSPVTSTASRQFAFLSRFLAKELVYRRTEQF